MPLRSAASRARGFEQGVEIALVRLPGVERLGLARDVDGAIDADAGGERQRAVGDVGDDDLRGAGAPRRDGAQCADRAAAADERALAHQRTGAARRMQRHRERLGHRGFGQAHAVGRDVRLRFEADDRLAECALDMREAHRATVEPHVEALVLPPLQAIAAVIAGHARTDRDAVADLDSPRLRADRFDDAGDFVAENHRFLQPHGAEAAVVVIVEIRAADAAESDAHADILRAERRARTSPRS